MRAGVQDELERLLEAAGGDPASLAGAQRARLEALLAEVADEVGRPEPALAGALERVERASLPAPHEWDRVWRAIDGALEARGRAERKRSLIFRLRLPAVAGIAAALVLAVLLAVPRSMTTSGAPIRLASEVEIHELEVWDGTPFVVSVGSNGAEVVWVLSADG